MQTRQIAVPATPVEWIIVAGIAVAISLAVIRIVGSNANNVFSTVGSAMNNDAGAIQAAANTAASAEDRKLLRKGMMSLIVNHPADCVEKIRQLTGSAGGYIVVSEISSAENTTEASMTVRIPVAQFDTVRIEIRKLGLRVESDRQESEDVTRQYVDQEARLRNLHAQEMQYLGILKQSSTVKDTMSVAEKLNEVRGEIEQQQAEFNTLSKQTETVELKISLRAISAGRVGWEPWLRVKQSAHDGMEAIADYAGTMTWVLFYLPAAILWLGTFLVSTIGGWKILRWVERAFFPSAKATPAQKAS